MKENLLIMVNEGFSLGYVPLRLAKEISNQLLTEFARRVLILAHLIWIVQYKL